MDIGIETTRLPGRAPDPRHLLHDTMIPLRIVALFANGLFIAYGYMAPVYPQHLLLRLFQMLQLISKVSRLPAKPSYRPMGAPKNYFIVRSCRNAVSITVNFLLYSMAGEPQAAAVGKAARFHRAMDPPRRGRLGQRTE